MLRLATLAAQPKARTCVANNQVKQVPRHCIRQEGKSGTEEEEEGRDTNKLQLWMDCLFLRFFFVSFHFH